MYEGKIGTDKWFPVIIVDAGNNGLGGVAYNDANLTIRYHYEGATSTSDYTPGSADWKEAASAGTAHDGQYWLRIGESEFSSAGKYEVSIAYTGYQTHRIPIEVRSFTLEDVFTGANIVTLKVKSVDVNNAYGTAVAMKSTGSNGIGLDIAGEGSGDGLRTTGGATGNGQNNIGGSTSGHGLENVATDGYGQYNHTGLGDGCRNAGGAGGNGEGLHNIGGNTGAGTKNVGGTAQGHGLENCATGADASGIQNYGSGAGSGIKNEAGATGHGIESIGGATSGHGARFVAIVGNSEGIDAQGYGSAPGIGAYGGETGSGIETCGGLTSGHGIDAKARNNGSGIVTTAVGVNAAIKVQAPDGDGIAITSNAANKDISAKEIGTPTDLASGANLSDNMVDIYGAISGSDLLITEMYGRMGVPTDLGSGATLADNMVDIGGKVDDANTNIGTPVDLGDGATIADNMTSIAGKTGGAATFNRLYDSLEAISDAESDNLSTTSLKNLLFDRNVTGRHANGKPALLAAGSGADAVVVTTVLDTDPGMEEFVKTESWAPAP